MSERTLQISETVNAIVRFVREYGVGGVEEKGGPSVNPPLSLYMGRGVKVHDVTRLLNSAFPGISRTPAYTLTSPITLTLLLMKVEPGEIPL